MRKHTFIRINPILQTKKAIKRFLININEKRKIIINEQYTKGIIRSNELTGVSEKYTRRMVRTIRQHQVTIHII